MTSEIGPFCRSFKWALAAQMRFKWAVATLSSKRTELPASSVTRMLSGGCGAEELSHEAPHTFFMACQPPPSAPCNSTCFTTARPPVACRNSRDNGQRLGCSTTYGQARYGSLCQVLSGYELPHAGTTVLTSRAIDIPHATICAACCQSEGGMQPETIFEHKRSAL